MLRSPKSDKTLAHATATLVVQRQINDEDATAQAFTTEVDALAVLRRIGDVTVRTMGDVVELRADVEYGPVFGCHESDFTRHLKLLRGKGEVFNFRRHAVSVEGLAAALSNLEAQVDDMALPLATRKYASKRLAQLRDVRA